MEDDVGAGRQGLLLPGFRAHVFLPEDHMDLAAQPGQAPGGGGSSVATSQHGYVLVSKEHAVAGGAVGQAPAQEAFRLRKGELPGGCPHGEDHGSGGVSAPGGFHNFGASSQVQPGHLGLKKGGSCSLCPCQHGVCQVLSGCSGDARVVFHPGGDRHLPARRGRLHQEGGQPLPSAVERGAAAARSCSNYNEFVVHWAPSFDEGSMPGF
ncbi:unknown [Firmicutes bacterium CAG:137]|nr:unknown [Firmicutes bacterium CAG:137]